MTSPAAFVIGGVITDAPNEQYDWCPPWWLVGLAILTGLIVRGIALAARLKISRYWRSTRFSRSSPRNLARSSVASTPGRPSRQLVLRAPITQCLL